MMLSKLKVEPSAHFLVEEDRIISIKGGKRNMPSSIPEVLPNNEGKMLKLIEESFIGRVVVDVVKKDNTILMFLDNGDYIKAQFHKFEYVSRQIRK